MAERLTGINSDWSFLANYLNERTVFDGDRIKAEHDRLFELENAEEQGLIVKTCTYSQEDSDSNLWQCSNCHCEWNFECGGVVENYMKYCPECGAKITHITTRHFDYDADEYIEETLTREEAEHKLSEDADAKK